jgi:molecular chaperone DnaJ
MKDYYKILEVEEQSSDDDIKKSYRNLSKKYHPDVNAGGEEKFKDIAEAYDVLSNKDKRAQYDNQKSNPYGGTPFEDLFTKMFNQRNQQQQQHFRRKSAPDKIVKVQVSPIESYRASVKTVNYFREQGCGVCKGTGGDTNTCGTCGGVGFQLKTFGTGFMVQQVRTMCPSCNGRGSVIINKCHHCSGKGTKTATQEIRINIPYGADDGQFLKLQNLGDFSSGEYGDLVIQIEMTPTDGYEKMNNDLIYNLYLTLEQAQQDKFNIPHPDGDLMMSAPATFDTSKPLRLRGKGYSGGDMYVKLHVKFERTT